MDQPARLPRERDREKEREPAGDGKGKTVRGKERERETERETATQGDSMLLRTYRRTMAARTRRRRIFGHTCPAHK